MSHKKFGPDRFNRFDVYWIQTNKQTNRQTDKPNLYIDVQIKLYIFLNMFRSTKFYAGNDPDIRLYRNYRERKEEICLQVRS